MPAVTVARSEPLAVRCEALASGQWDAARSAFEEAVDEADSPEALDGLGRALSNA